MNMSKNVETEMAVIKEQLKEINDKLDDIKKWITAHEAEKVRLVGQFDARIKVNEMRNARQQVINAILAGLGGAAVAGVVTILVQTLLR